MFLIGSQGKTVRVFDHRKPVVKALTTFSPEDEKEDRLEALRMAFHQPAVVQVREKDIDGTKIPFINLYPTTAGQMPAYLLSQRICAESETVDPQAHWSFLSGQGRQAVLIALRQFESLPHTTAQAT